MPEPSEKIDCQRAHELLSQRMDVPLEPAELARLKLHLAICDFCVRLDRQLQLLREAMRRMGR